MARYNGRLHCIVGVLPTCYKRKAAVYFYPPGGKGPASSESTLLNPWLFQWKIVFYFTHEHQKWYFHWWHSWLRHSWKYCFCCSFGEIKINLTLKKSNILYLAASSESTLLNPLYNSTHYNSRILYRVILICTEQLFFSKYLFLITTNSA